MCRKPTEFGRCVLLPGHSPPRGEGPMSDATGLCVCASIVASDPTRHFKECPLRDLHPEASVEAKARQALYGRRSRPPRRLRRACPRSVWHFDRDA